MAVTRAPKAKAKTTKKNGRPTIFTKKLGDVICVRVAEGESMRSVSRDENMPAMTTLFRWLRENTEFRQQYEIAKEESADVHAEDVIHISDHEASSPVIVDGIPLMIDGKIVYAVDSASVAHARLRVDARKWVASKLKPKKYGERVHNEHSGQIGLGDVLNELDGASHGLPTGS